MMDKKTTDVHLCRKSATVCTEEKGDQKRQLTVWEVSRTVSSYCSLRNNVCVALTVLNLEFDLVSCFLEQIFKTKYLLPG